MKHIVLTRKDILDALDVKAHVFRQLVEKLAPYRNQESTIRISRKFNKRDLLFFSVVKFLLFEFCLPTETIGIFSEQLHMCLSRPLSATSPGSIFINMKTGEVVPYRSMASDSGIVVELEPHVRRCNAFFETEDIENQPSLPFNLVDVLEQKRSSEVRS